MIQTIKADGAGETKNTAANAKLTALTEEVERMSAVFEEANKAREEQRKMMEELHQDTLRRINMTRDYMTQESKRLSDTMKSFTAKFEHELQSMKDELMTTLNTKVSSIRHNLSGLDVRAKELDQAIDQERKDRIKQTEEVLGPLQRRVDKVTTDLEKEKKIRQTREQELMKELLDAVESLNGTVDMEKFNREQQYMDFKQTSEKERQNLEDRQVRIRTETALNLQALRSDLELETGNRIDNQDGIVDNVTVFIKRFQENIKEEGKMG